MKNFQELIDYVETCSLEEFKALNKEFSRLHDARSKRTKEADELEKAKAKARLEELLKKTSYEAPEYPQFDYDLDEMGSEQRDGKCVFTNQEESEELVGKLIQQSYYYGHYFKWQGPGRYLIKPSWEYDCSGEVIYSAHYEIEEAL